MLRDAFEKLRLVGFIYEFENRIFRLGQLDQGLIDRRLQVLLQFTPRQGRRHRAIGWIVVALQCGIITIHQTAEGRFDR